MIGEEDGERKRGFACKIWKDLLMREEEVWPMRG